ncbi:sulfocyanin-like copper-binding protein [Candidatus Palauibacter sp.]|uniref:sulfocyanin-like copper-binding protein n=1 Tax=Candidatus Palauibacter sp. TaxID=3101350 RepID=UPI003B59AA0B
MIHRSGPLAAALVVLWAAIGCSGDAEPPDRAGDPPPAADAALSANLDTIYAADAVDVALLEYAIGMPTRLPAGPTVLRLSNQGFEMHNLKLVDPESGDVLWETETDVNTGETRLEEIVFAPGTYWVVCDIAGHDTRGMYMTLTVEARADR